MNLGIFILGKYSYFVWPAFIFAFLSCFYLYIKTIKELKKYDKLFLVENKQEKTDEASNPKPSSGSKEEILGASII